MASLNLLTFYRLRACFCWCFFSRVGRKLGNGRFTTSTVGFQRSDSWGFNFTRLLWLASVSSLMRRRKKNASFDDSQGERVWSPSNRFPSCEVFTSPGAFFFFFFATEKIKALIHCYPTNRMHKTRRAVRFIPGALTLGATANKIDFLPTFESLSSVWRRGFSTLSHNCSCGLLLFLAACSQRPLLSKQQYFKFLLVSHFLLTFLKNVFSKSLSNKSSYNSQ